jgi:hypothetical protein
MVTDRLMTIFELLAQHERTRAEGGALCSVAADLTDLSGAGIVLGSAGRTMTTFCTSNDAARSLMDIETMLGEGPGVDACSSEGAVDEVNLPTAHMARWLAYTPLAVSAGAGAVFGFPVRIGAVRLGALSLFRNEPGTLTESQASDAYLMSSVIARAILSFQAGASPGTLAAELEREATFDFSVHQAAGMVAVQGSMSVGDALVALRAHAFAIGIPLSQLAISIVVRDIYFDPITGAWRDDLGSES